MKIYSDDIAKQSEVTEQAVINAKNIEQINQVLAQHAADLDEMDNTIHSLTNATTRFKRDLKICYMFIGLSLGLIVGSWLLLG